MTSQTKLWALSAGALALSLALAGCGGGGSSSGPAPVSGGGGGTTTTTTPVTGMVADVPQTTGIEAAAGGDPVTIAAGMSMTVGGVMFSCAEGEEDCTVTIASGDDGVTATWSGAEVTAAFVDPLMAAEMNDWSTDVIQARIRAILAQDATAGIDNSVDMTAMHSGLDGVAATPFLLTGQFNPNAVDDAGTNDTDESMVSLRYATPTDTDALSVEDAGALGLGSPWWHEALHKDWGDSASGSADGGYETFAVVYSDYAGGLHTMAFDADLARKIADDTESVLFTFNANLIEDEDPNVAVMDSREFTVSDTAAAPGGARTGVNANAADAGTLTEILRTGEKVEGTYFGAEGSYTCGGTNAECSMSRDDGDVAFTLGVGTWQFTPDDDVMVMLTDQDWVSFGVWLTAPDNEIAANSIHRIGVFEQGKDEYDFAGTSQRSAGGESLTGTATYAGSAAGIYVDNGASGLFTATASLTAAFGTGSEGGSLSGSIHSFQNTDGTYLGDDPDDPSGNSDWTVDAGQHRDR